MAKSKQPGSKQDRQWAEAKRRCRLNQEDIRMARELGLNPRSLIKNIPSPQQQWKLLVKQWIHELYEKKTGKMPGKKKKRRTAQSLKLDEPAANGAIPLQAYANELSLVPDSEHSTLATTMADREEYGVELRDDNEPLYLPESPCTGRSGRRINEHKNGRKTFSLPPKPLHRRLDRYKESFTPTILTDLKCWPKTCLNCCEKSRRWCRRNLTLT